VESLAASLLMKLGWVNEVVFAYGAFEVRGRGVELARSLSLPVTGVLLLITALFMYREYRSGRFGERAFPRYAAALILAFMLGSKVLSPQYAIWLLPLVPLGAGGITGIVVSAVFLAVCWMTTQVYPIHYADLLEVRFPGPDLLITRNLLLVALWSLLLLLPEKDAP
jgi:fatty acid desaturase